MPGTITFRPIEANINHDTDWLGKMDPYCSFTIGNQKAKSQVCKHGGTHPQWGDTVTLQAENASVCHLHIMDKDRFRPDDNIASADIDLNEVAQRGRVNRWYPIYHHRKLAGEILLEIAYDTGIVQQPVFVQPVQQTTYYQENVRTSAGPSYVESTTVGQPVVTSTHVVAGQNIGGGIPLQQGQFISGQNQGFRQEEVITTSTYVGGQQPLIGGTSLQQGQLLSGGNLAGGQLIGGQQSNYYNQVPGGNLINNTGNLAGGLPPTNAGYSERPGYTLGTISNDPITESNLDSNGGGFFTNAKHERKAEPYSLTQPGTYGIPHGQTVDTAGHLQPNVDINRPAPIGQINQPGVTGYPDEYTTGGIESTTT